MNRGPITVRYAKGLFELGKEKDVLDKLYKDSFLLLQHCREVKDFCLFLNNPVVKNSRKKEVVQKILGQEQHPFMLKFINLVIDHNREALLPDMVLYFEELYKKHKGIRNVKIVTAVDLGQQYTEELQVFLERELDAPIELHHEVKPGIIGGVILIVDGKILDNSIAHQLKLMKKKILS
ncbi:MAG: ATP synthase F1 subunit delta [Marinilabiliaceae bacterium]